MNDLILFPFNGNAREAVPVVEAINRNKPVFNLLGFIDDALGKKNRTSSGFKVLGARDTLSRFPSAAILAVPGRPDNFIKRREIIQSLGVSESRFATVIHPSAQIGSGVQIGVNTLIMAGVVITAEVFIGSHCVILPNTVISHDCRIGDYCMIGSNVSISGGIKIGALAYIGSGSRIIQEITIGEKSLIGMGSVVTHSTQPGTVVAGCPAKLIRKV